MPATAWRVGFVVLATAAAGVAATLAGAAGSKSCVVPSSQTRYETTTLQIYERHLPEQKIATIVCTRSSGQGRTVNVAVEPYGEDTVVNRVLDGRYVWLQDQTTAEATLDDTNVDELVDLTTGRNIGETTYEDEANDDGTAAIASAVAVPGALITSDGSAVGMKVLATRKATTLDPDTDKAMTHQLAASEHVIYWLHGDTTMSAPVPSATASPTTHAARAPATPAPDAQTAKAKRPVRCELAHTSTLLRADGGELRVYRAAGARAATACLRSNGRRTVMTTVLPHVTATGGPSQIDDLAGARSFGFDDLGKIRYAFAAMSASGPATAIVVLDVRTGKVVQSALAPANTTDWVAGETPAVGVGSRLDDVLAFTDGKMVAMVDHLGLRVVAQGTDISDLALSPDLSDQGNRNTEKTGRLYWTAAGTPTSVPTGVAPHG